MSVRSGTDELEARELVRTTSRTTDRQPAGSRVTSRGRNLVVQIDKRLRACEVVFDELTSEQRRAPNDILMAFEPDGIRATSRPRNLAETRCERGLQPTNPRRDQR